MKTKHIIASIIVSSAALSCTPSYACDKEASCPTEVKHAVTGAVADEVSTLIVKNAGGTELNPVGLMTIPIKIVAYNMIDNIDDKDKKREYFSIWSGVSWGATASNLCIAATFNPLCYLLGIVVGVSEYNSLSNK